MPDWMKTVAWPRLRQGKRVLAVEGDDDKDVYSAWLKKLTRPGTIVSDKLVVVVAGDKHMSDWVDHWSLWVTTCRVSRQLADEAFPGLFHDQLPIPDDAAIEARLNSWAGVVDPGVVLAAFQHQRSEARLKAPSEQFRGCVHAKKFYPRVVVGEALQPIERVDSKSWMRKLAKWMAEVPADLAPMLRPLLQ